MCGSPRLGRALATIVALQSMDALGRVGPPYGAAPGERCGRSGGPPHGRGITAADESITIACGHHRAAGPSFDAANLLNLDKGRRDEP